MSSGVAALALLAGGAALLDLRTQWGVWRAEQAARAQELALARGDRSTAERDPGGVGTAPRALVYRALTRARMASVADGADRGRLLAEAMGLIAAAERRRPDWGEALTVHAYIATLADNGRIGDRVLGLLAASYRAAPYLHDAGGWRARVGLKAWSRLPADVRSRTIDEAVWVARLSTAASPAMFDAARASPAYARFATAWVSNRRGDRDLTPPGERAAP